MDKGIKGRQGQSHDGGGGGTANANGGGVSASATGGGGFQSWPDLINFWKNHEPTERESLEVGPGNGWPSGSSYSHASSSLSSSSNSHSPLISSQRMRHT